MEKKKILSKKFILMVAVVACVTMCIELFIFNFDALRSRGQEEIVVACDCSTDESGEYLSDEIEVNCDVSNICADLTVQDYDIAYVHAVLTDEGDEYEYSTPEYVVCNGVQPTKYSNIYPAGKVHTIRLGVRAAEGTSVIINSLSVNSRIPTDIKPVRVMIIFAVLLMGVLLWKDSFIHNVYFDTHKKWQYVVTLCALLVVIVTGKKMADSNPMLKVAPWPHHKQYQELARSLEAGSVVLDGHVVDDGLIEAANPYDTIALTAKGIPYSMDYAYYDGNYYVYFGIIPEVLFFYPYYRHYGADMSNATVIYIMYTIFAIGTFLFSFGMTRKYIKSIPYFLWLMVTVCMCFVANFVYLCARPDIYNIPVMGAIAFGMMGLGLIRNALDIEHTKTRVYVCKCILLFAGAFCMAAVAGCRPQLLLIAGVLLIWMLFEDGIKNRKIFTKKTIIDTFMVVVPFAMVAALVCWYNYARFGNILDFGATYSLTTNDMNHRPFNWSRLLRGLYSFFLQPANMTTDFPFLMPTVLDCNYMGRYMVEYTLGGMLSSDGFFLSVILLVGCGFKKIDRPIRALIIYMLVAALVIAGFDANGAGVLYRYTCDCALPLTVAAGMMWMLIFDKGRNIIRYDIGVKIGYIAILAGLFYSLLTFAAGDNSLSLSECNRALYYTIATYFGV